MLPKNILTFFAKGIFLHWYDGKYYILTIFYLFSTPINCSDLEFHSSFEVENMNLSDTNSATIGALLARCRCCCLALWLAAELYTWLLGNVWLELNLRWILVWKLSGFCIGKTVRLRTWESPSLLYSIWNLSEFDF